MLRAENISYSIQRKNILRSINLTINPGSITALIGPNGSGKSSLIKILSGEWQTQKGAVWLEDIPLQEYTSTSLAQRRAVLAQSIDIAFDFTVEEIIMLAKTPFQNKVRKNISKKMLRELLRWIGLPNYEKKIYTELSGGEKKRVQIARVWAQLKGMNQNESRYLFLDEPEAHLDLAWKTMPLQAAQYQAQQGVGVVVALHSLELASTFADNILLLKKGNPVAYGKPEEVLTQKNICFAFDLTTSQYKSFFSFHPAEAIA